MQTIRAVVVMHFKASEAKASFHKFQKEIW